jgi:2-aminoethylphosphonate aminotransferase
MIRVKRNVLLNPGPGTTSDQVKAALFVPDICPREKEFCDIMDSIKLDLPKIVFADETYTAVLFASSGTGAIEATITSSIPKKGKLLVVENGAYGARMCKIAERYLIDYHSYKIPYGDYPDVNEIRKIIESDNTITHVAIVDHETTTGMRNPVQEICDLAHSNNIEVIVDCMSSFAGLYIDITKWGAEYIVSTSNKCIQGMAGLSFVIFKRSLLENIKYNARSFYFDLYSQYDGFYSTGQMQFTPPVQVVYAFRKAIDLCFSETVEGRLKRYKTNYMLLYNGLKEIGFKFLIPDQYQSGILLALVEPDNPNYNFNKMHDYLYEKGFTIYPGKGAKKNTFRLSILGDLYPQDIKRFIVALTDYLRTNKIHPLYF